MKPQRRSPESLARLPDHPIDILPFDPMSKKQASAYSKRLNQLLVPYAASAELFGSVDLEIAGKGEWEFAIYLDDEQWFPVVVELINHYGSIYTLIDDFAVFTDTYEGVEVEIIPMRGESAVRNKAIMNYWRSIPVALKEYEAGKLEHAHSKREYYTWKDEFIARIVESLPDQ